MITLSGAQEALVAQGHCKMLTRNFSLPSTLPSTIFRAYDIRGIVDVLTEDVVYAIGLAIGTQAIECGQQKILVAQDGRLSGPKLFAALCQGLLTTGCDVVDIGKVPTPTFYFATHHLDCPSGVILTGSHNPANYNGLKILLQGKALTTIQVQALYQRILAGHLLIHDKSKWGQYTQKNIIDDYQNRIVHHIALKKPIKVVIDCGNGIGGMMAPNLFRRLGCEVIELYCEVNGHFPNHHPDPSQVDNLKDLIMMVQTHGADLGLAFDGDADRLGVVTNRGDIIWPDRLLMLYAKDVLERLPGSKIVFDVKCSRHLGQWITALGGTPFMWKTGHSLIKDKMREVGAALAGEMSGHIFFKERWYGFDDGLYAAARLLEILANQQQTITEVFMSIPNSINTPELNIPMADLDKFNFIKKLINQTKQQKSLLSEKLTTIDGLRVDFIDGWGLVRASNTTACLTLRFEADNTEALMRIQTAFRELLLSVNPSLCLPF